MKRFVLPSLITIIAVLLALSAIFPLAETGTAAPASVTPVRNTIVVQVQASDDDTSVQLATGENRNDWVWIRLGASETHYVNGFRFQGVDIPPGSRIIQAKLMVFKSEWQTNFPIEVEIRAEATDSAQSFADSEPLASERPLTAAAVEWEIAAPPPNYEWFDAPDITEMVQEVIDRPGWASGNALAIIIKSVESNPDRHYLDLQSFDFNPAHAPKLEIVYETDVPVPTSTPTLTPTPTITPTPEPGRLAIERAEDITCDARYDGDTMNWDNNVNFYTACRAAWPETGPEAVYRLDLPSDNTDVHLQIFPNDPSQDLDIFLLTGAYPEDCLQGADASLFLSNMNAGVYYVAVDGYNGAAGAFTLVSNCTIHFTHGLYVPMILLRK